MNERELIIKQISEEFTKWEVGLRNLGSMNLLDAHVFSEDTVCELLNLIFDYQLVNSNRIKQNFPSIDLADRSNSVCFQVTSVKSSGKIQRTIDAFLKHELNLEFNELFIVILGRKQGSYSRLNVPAILAFEPSTNIIDFHDLLRLVLTKPLSRMRMILKVLTASQTVSKPRAKSSRITQVRKNLRMKKKIVKELVRAVDRDDWDMLSFEPWIKFNYSELVIRNIEDTTWPNIDFQNTKGISPWFKSELWDLYENGIELVSMGGYAIFNEKGEWDILDWKGDAREENPAYKKVRYNYYARIPYEYIVELDMDLDPYEALPTLYVEYAKDGEPYEEVLIGSPGVYRLKMRPTKFDNDKRRKLK